MNHNSNGAVHLDEILTLRQQIADLQQERPRDQQELSTLRAERDYFRMIADFTYDWDYWRAPDGSYRYVSPACERITGYQPAEFQTDPGLLRQIIHPDDRAHVLRHLDDSEQHQQSSEMEFRIITRSGEVRWIEQSCQSVYGHDGTWLGQQASNRDITERKEAEDASATPEGNASLPPSLSQWRADVLTLSVRILFVIGLFTLIPLMIIAFSIQEFWRLLVDGYQGTFCHQGQSSDFCVFLMG